MLLFYQSLDTFFIDKKPHLCFKITKKRQFGHSQTTSLLPFQAKFDLPQLLREVTF